VREEKIGYTLTDKKYLPSLPWESAKRNLKKAENSCIIYIESEREK